MMAVTAWLVDLKWVHEHAQSLNGVLLFLLMAVLPLIGVPVSILYVVGGAKFGHTWGLVIAAAAIAIHLLGSWWIAHSWLKRPLEALCTGWAERGPKCQRVITHPSPCWSR